jgi:hypothetical protein
MLVDAGTGALPLSPFGDDSLFPELPQDWCHNL